MKFRVHAKNSSVLIKGKPSFGEKINEREADYLVNSSVPGFFSISYDGKKQLVYEAPCTMVLAKYLKETKLSEAAFWKIMAQMLDVQIAAKSRGLYPEHLCVRPDMVFLEERTLQMYFLYQPVTGAKETADSLFAVIHDMIYEELKKEGGKGRKTSPVFLSRLPFRPFRDNLEAPEHGMPYRHAANSRKKELL